MEWAVAHLDPAWIQHELVRKLVSQRFAAHRQGAWISLAAFVGECENPEMRSLLTGAAIQDRPVPNTAQQLADVVLRMRNQFIDRQLAAIMQQINQPETTEAQQLDLLRQQEALRLLKRRPLSAAGEA
jgi:hypothetical protein